MSVTVRTEPKRRLPIVVVLGMHRSGTSLCAHILSMLGLDMADGVLPKSDAPKGHWERLEIVNTHDRILQFLNRDYYSPLHAHAFPPGWWAEPPVRVARNELAAWLRQRIGDSPRFGFKDPRTCRMMPMWKEIFADVGLEPRYVFCVRDPRQVGRSIADRDHLAYDDSEYRWMVYNAHAVVTVGEAPVCVVPYEAWFADPAPILARMAALTHAPMHPDDPELKATVADVIDSNLRHDDPAAGIRLSQITREFYAQLNGAAGAGRFTDASIALARHFLGFERLMAPAQQEFAKLRMEREATTQQLAAMRVPTG